jgi:hypothetical protein
MDDLNHDFLLVYAASLIHFSGKSTEHQPTEHRLLQATLTVAESKVPCSTTWSRYMLKETTTHSPGKTSELLLQSPNMYIQQ